MKLQGKEKVVLNMIKKAKKLSLGIGRAEAEVYDKTNRSHKAVMVREFLGYILKIDLNL